MFCPVPDLYAILYTANIKFVFRGREQTRAMRWPQSPKKVKILSEKRFNNIAPGPAGGEIFLRYCTLLHGVPTVPLHCLKDCNFAYATQFS